MADTLEIKKLKLEKARVSTAKLEMELRIHERMEEIQRLEENMAVQEKKESELDAKLAELQSK